MGVEISTVFRAFAWCAKSPPTATASEEAVASRIPTLMTAQDAQSSHPLKQRVGAQAHSRHGPAAAPAHLLPPGVLRLDQSTPTGGHRLPARGEPRPPRGERFSTTAPD